MQWDVVINKSFKICRPSKNRMKGIDDRVKRLMEMERDIKSRGQSEMKQNKLLEIQKEIGETIAENIKLEMENKLEKITQSSCPQAEVFKIRRETKRNVSMDFPLKDKSGNIRVSRDGIDTVISDHFTKVFQQNSVTEGWESYWEYVNKIYELISLKECSDYKIGPTFEEINEIINDLNKNKAVYGTMRIDLVKMAGDELRKVIHMCVSACFESGELPDEFRVEKMVLLYKNKGKLDELDNYRGIFLRLLILSIYQKWLYKKCSPIVNENGSDTAFGGRKGKAGIQALLIVKLLQDHAVWTKEQLIFKFLDVEKFFDSMNFKKCLIDVYNSGVTGKYWKAYQNINESKRCVPYIPSGACSEISVKNVFVQGSTDAVLMAWNHMDALNKKSRTIWSKRVVVQGIIFDTLTFVDDIVEMCKSLFDVIVGSARVEVIQGETRLNFKPPKCKLLVMNGRETISDNIGKIMLEVVKRHPYLGTEISDDGKRNEEIKKRMGEAKSVSNEIVSILKSVELSQVRLKYVGMLAKTCLDEKLKYGCAVWNCLNQTQIKELNAIKVNMLKRVMKLPYSTPSVIIQYEFGIIDLDLEVAMEKVLLYFATLRSESSDIGRRLLVVMMSNRVPGFCREVVDAMHVLDMFGNDDAYTQMSKDKLRETGNAKMVCVQQKKIMEKMMEVSKSDNLLLQDFKFDGKMQDYLLQLPFEEARVLFMLRSRMFPTKGNFKGRWSSDDECEFCSLPENDKHLFACPAYLDMTSDLNYYDIVSLKLETDELHKAAIKLNNVKERLETFNKSK